VRGIKEIAEDAEGFSRSTFSTRDGADFGFGPTRTIVATIDGDDIDHEIAEDLDADVAEPLARLLNDVNPLVAEVCSLRAQLDFAASENFAFNVKVAKEISEARAYSNRLHALLGEAWRDHIDWRAAGALDLNRDQPDSFADRLHRALRGEP
jgi:hypothetical protein